MTYLFKGKLLLSIERIFVCLFSQKPANILVMGEGPERGRVKIGMLYFDKSQFSTLLKLL